MTAIRESATRSADAATLLQVFAVVLLVVPAALAVGSIAALTPALLLGLLCAWLWALGRMLPSLQVRAPRHPVRLALYAFGAAVLASYVGAAARGLEPLQANAADRGVVITVAGLGVALLALDGITTRARLDRLLATLVTIGAAISVVGIIQFVWGVDLTENVRVPGLTAVDIGYDAITQRSMFNRVAGTALHPIEFGTVLAMLVPFGLHLAHGTGRARWWLATALMATAIPMSVSRTGSVALLVVLVVLVPSWERPRRMRMLGIGALFLVALRLAVPGLLGTIRALFSSFWVDPSITTRRDDYSYVGEFLSERPWFGRGFATFIPDEFDYLDNQYLLSLVEIGIVGTVALAALFASGIVVARAARKRVSDATTRDLAQSFAAALAVPLVTCATFDYLSFPSARGLGFLLLGCAGALWRITAPGRSPGPDPVRAGTGAVAPA